MKKEIKRLLISLSPSLHKVIKIQAAQDGTSMNQWIIQAILAELVRRQKKEKVI
jgi:predicted HicB family RNase H-like nuclease